MTPKLEPTRINFREQNLNPINIINRVIVTDTPAHMICPHCSNFVTTKIVRRNGKFAWLLATGLCLIWLVWCKSFK